MRTGTTQQPIDVIELQTAVIGRNVEMFRRRGEVYIELDPAEYLLLRTLDGLGPMDIRTLATAVGVDPSTAGRQIGAMHTAGLVDRTPDPGDRRRTIISVTAEGLRRTEVVRDRRRDNLRALLDDWSPEDLETLGVMFGRYNAAVSDRYVTNT